MDSNSVNPPMWWLFGVALSVVACQHSLTTLIATKPLFRDGRNLSFVLLTDQDKASKHAEQSLWTSHAKVGNLVSDAQGMFNLSWVLERDLTTTANVKGRSMELSAAAWFDEKLLAFCDRSGMVFELDLDNATANIQTQLVTPVAPFKAEWALNKDGTLMVGSSGKEWVTDGEVVHEHCKTVKVLQDGQWRDEDWSDRFQALREHLKCDFPGYLIHEAAAWDHRHREWLFLPRKVSTIPYDEDRDELLSGNILLRVSEDFSQVTSVPIGPLEKDWGFTALVLLADTLQTKYSEPTLLMAVKVREVKGRVESKLAVFDSEGQFRWQDTQQQFMSLGARKFEALSFLQKSTFVQPDPAVEGSSAVEE